MTTKEITPTQLEDIRLALLEADESIRAHMNSDLIMQHIPTTAWQWRALAERIRDILSPNE